MAVTSVFRNQSGTKLTIKSSGGSAAITLASLANSSSESTGARQSAKLDLGATRAREWTIDCEFELAATPTAGNVIEIWWSPSDNSTAATSNKGGASGTDASYTGYSSNISASLKQCQFIGNFVCTAQATSTVQKAIVSANFMPANRYGSLIVFNKSGAAFHSSDSNCCVNLTPNEPTAEPS